MLQVLDKAEHDGKNYQGRSLGHLMKPTPDNIKKQYLDHSAIMTKPYAVTVLFDYIFIKICHIWLNFIAYCCRSLRGVF